MEFYAIDGHVLQRDAWMLVFEAIFIKLDINYKYFHGLGVKFMLFNLDDTDSNPSLSSKLINRSKTLFTE
jgi:hypothetical protein